MRDQLTLADARLQARIERNARRVAPLVRRNECVSTIDVPGQGDSCLRPDGEWQVAMPGADIVTHGGDPIAAANYVIVNLDAGAQATLNAATKSDIRCAVNARAPHFRAIYARPADVAYRPALAGALRTELYKASAFMNLNAQRDGAGRETRLRMACDASGEITVDQVSLPTPSTADDFGSIARDLRSAGYVSSGESVNKYVVYYDAMVGPGTYGAAGQAEAFNDPSATPTNVANSPGSMSVNFSSWVGYPEWDVLLHEMSHAMGAVQVGAPQSTGASHCNVDADIMCYADGGPLGQATTSVCQYTELDCGNDTYFFAGVPAAGTWLASNWNVAAPANRFLDHGAFNVDLTSPTTPNGLSAATSTSTSITTTWRSSIDDSSGVRYQVERLAGGTWTAIATTNATTYTITGLQPRQSLGIRVVATDASGNASNPSNALTASSAADTAAPSTPGQPRRLSATDSSVALEWGPSVDDVSVSTYRVLRRTSSDPVTWQQVGASDSPSHTLTGLPPSNSITIAVQAVDGAGNASPLSPWSTVATENDTAAPADPVVTGFDAAIDSIVLHWTTPDDASGVTRYLIEQLIDGGAWIQVGVSTTATAAVGGLSPLTNYTFRILAIDGAGNRSLGAQTAIAFTAGRGDDTPIVIAQPPTTAPPFGPIVYLDRLAPNRPTGFRIASRTSRSATVSWIPAIDMGGGRVERYAVWIKVGGRWIARGTTQQPADRRHRPAIAFRALRAGTRYVIAVQSIDSSGNRSARSTWAFRTR